MVPIHVADSHCRKLYLGFDFFVQFGAGSKSCVFHRFVCKLPNHTSSQRQKKNKPRNSAKEKIPPQLTRSCFSKILVAFSAINQLHI